MSRLYLFMSGWGVTLGAAILLAADRLWPAVIAVTVLLIVAPVLWATNELANRIEDLERNR
jgi:hypothetical protein